MIVLDSLLGRGVLFLLRRKLFRDVVGVFPCLCNIPTFMRTSSAR